jgi:hypothetical protein
MDMEQPFIAGELTKIYRKCGNPNCRCAVKGAKSILHIFQQQNLKVRAKQFQIPAKSRHWLILFVQRHSHNKKSYFFILFLYIHYIFNILIILVSG